LLSYFLHSKEYCNLNAWRNPIFKTWIIFIITMVLGLFGSLDRGLTFTIIQAIAKYLIVIAIMVKIIDSESRLDFIIKIYSFCGVAMAGSTILNYSSGINFKSSLRGSAVESGIFADPNDLALFLNTTLPFLFYFYYKSKNRTLPLLAIIIVELAVVLTYSRGGFLGSCVVLLSVSYFRKSERGRILKLILLGFILFVFFAPEEYKERLSTIFVESKVDQQTGKYPGRMQAWIELLPKGMERPVLGCGAGCSVYLAGNRDNGDWVLVHNTFLQAFLEMGFIGFFSYIFLYVIPFRQYRTVKMKAIKLQLNSIVDRYQFILVSLIGFAATAFFIPQVFSPIMFILTGITLIQFELAEKAILLSSP